MESGLQRLIPKGPIRDDLREHTSRWFRAGSRVRCYQVPHLFQEGSIFYFRESKMENLSKNSKFFIEVSHLFCSKEANSEESRQVQRYSDDEKLS